MPPVSEPPPDVLAARATRTLTGAVLALSLAALLLGGASLAVLALTGSADPALPLLSLLGVGQLAAVAGAAATGYGLARMLRTTDDGAPPATGGRAAQATGHASAGGHSGPSPSTVTEGVAGALHLVARVLLVALVAVATAWAIARPGEVVGVLAGAVVGAQAAVLLTFVARRVQA